MSQGKIVIIGAGIAGLSAATILQEQGYQVTILEQSNAIGGLAKSRRNADDLPTEHALRVYSKRSYQYFLSILKRIPYNQGKVIDNLKKIHIGFQYGENYIPYAEADASFIDIMKLRISFPFALRKQGVPLFKLIKFAAAIFTLKFLSKIKPSIFFKTTQSMFDKINHEELHKFIQSGYHCSNAQNAEASISQLILTYYRAFSHDVRYCMNGPTSERLFTPWQQYLEKIGVTIRLNEKVKEINVENKKIMNVITESNTQYEAATFLIATSYNGLLELLKDSSLKHYCNDLALAHSRVENKIFNLGIQFYLSEIPPIDLYSRPGLLTIHVAQPWYVTSVVQASPFWDDVAIPNGIKRIVSVTFSGLNHHGALIKKPLVECSIDEIVEEVLYQLKLPKEFVSQYQIDDGLFIIPKKEFEDNKEQYEPCLVHYRQDGQVFIARNCQINYLPAFYQPLNFDIANLYLAGDYCSNTNFQHVTMEKAAESGVKTAQDIINHQKNH